jgi:hypothetical protein
LDDQTTLSPVRYESQIDKFAELIRGAIKGISSTELPSFFRIAKDCVAVLQGNSAEIVRESPD